MTTKHPYLRFLALGGILIAEFPRRAEFARNKLYSYTSGFVVNYLCMKQRELLFVGCDVFGKSTLQRGVTVDIVDFMTSVVC